MLDDWLFGLMSSSAATCPRCCRTIQVVLRTSKPGEEKESEDNEESRAELPGNLSTLSIDVGPHSVAIDVDLMLPEERQVSQALGKATGDKLSGDRNGS